MDHDHIANLYKNNPTFAALRKEWLPLAISFLHHVFKQKHEVIVSYDLFYERLDAYLEHLNQSLAEDKQYRQGAEHYIDRWSREDDLIRIRAREDGYTVQLSPHAERLLGWFDEMLNEGMIGTESRLRTIISLLDEVVAQSTEDVEARLNQLYERQEQIEAEINRIIETGQVDSLSDVQIRERLDYIQNMATQLLRDFSSVEERFRDMARQIQQAQLDPTKRRGDILASALDADEQLEESDEGQSFRAFYELLTHPQQRNTFDTLIDALFTTPRFSPFMEDNFFLQRLTSYLLDAGERVNQSNQRLAEHLRRVVDTRNITESRRVQHLSQEIKHIVSQLDEQIYPMMTSRRPFFSIEGDPDVNLPLERPLYDPPEHVGTVKPPRPASTLIDEHALTALYDTFYIDEGMLQDNIARLLMSRSEVSLVEVVTSYPITQGMAEVIAYVLIATREEQHMIDRTQQDTISIQTASNATPQAIIVPHIVFYRKSSTESIS